MDRYGRFQSQNSLAAKNDFLQLPVIDIWVADFKKVLQQKFKQLFKSEKQYKFLPTIDVDMAWSFKNKGPKRNLGGLLKDLSKLNFPQSKKRINVLAGNEKDPFDQFNYLNELHEKNEHKLFYFFLMANRGEFDKNISTENVSFQKLIQKLTEEYAIGIHPSYQSNSKPEILNSEKNKLEKISNQNITNSRQHFLKLEFPNTYRQLISVGIKDDYTMGYSDAIGFRTSTANPYKWYDLIADKSTDLTIHPFQVMDVTLKNYLKLSPTEAIQKVKEIIDQCKAVKGTFSTIWHNSSFDENEGWKNWKKVYEEIVEYAS